MAAAEELVTASACTPIASAECGVDPIASGECCVAARGDVTGADCREVLFDDRPDDEASA